MNLRDYIGNTRTESLPPGFLKSIKIKYKHEASHVFPRGVPSSRKDQLADQANAPSTEDEGAKNEDDGKRCEEVEEKSGVLPVSVKNENFHKRKQRKTCGLFGE